MKSTNELIKELDALIGSLSSTHGQPVEKLHMAAGISKEAGELLGLEDASHV